MIFVIMVSISDVNNHPMTTLKNENFDSTSIGYHKDILFEWGWGIGLTGVSCIFAATPYVATSLVVLTVNLLAVNLLCRMVAVIFNKLAFYSAHDTCRTLTSFNASLLYGTTGNILIHEFGHKTAVSSVYRNANPKISIDGLFAGSTSWKHSRYSSFGKLIGPINALRLLAASGALAAVAIATIGIIIALEWSSQTNYLRESILFSSIFSIVQHVTYSISAFSSDPRDLSHDFMALWKYGINPGISTAVLIFIPIAALSYRFFIKNNNNFLNK